MPPIESLSELSVFLVSTRKCPYIFYALFLVAHIYENLSLDCKFLEVKDYVLNSFVFPSASTVCLPVDTRELLGIHLHVLSLPSEDVFQRVPGALRWYKPSVLLTAHFESIP